MARRVSGLTLLFAAEAMQQENCGRDHNEEEEEIRVEKKETKDLISSSFQMPTQYPGYTREDYEAMPEWKIDLLLNSYGLPTQGDLNYKRGFAIGAFIWPDFHGQELSSHHPNIRDSARPNKNEVRAHVSFLGRLLVRLPIN